MVRSDENMNLQELQTLLEHARVLGQAAGILMERFSVDAAQAFDEIADAAGRSGKTANAVARALTSTRHWERATG